MSNPRLMQPGRDPALHPNRAPGRSLVESLGGVVDSLRQLATDFGLRPYRIFSVVVKWTGGSSGRGDAVVVSERELLPTPKLVDTASLEGEATPGGYLNRGSVRLVQVSPRYTEDDARALFHVQPLPTDMDGFIEMRIDARDGSTERRRFTVKSVPFRNAGRFEWVVPLTSQQGDRSRSGEVLEDVQSPTEVRVARLRSGVP